MKQLPKKLYGFIEGTGEDAFLSAHPEPETCVEQGETKRVGVYELVGFIVVVNKTEIRATGSGRSEAR